MFLKVLNLTKKYGDKYAIDNCSFEMAEGHLNTILGPSGCGKTSILRAIGGFLKPDCGKIFLEGIDITEVSPEEREVSTVFQSYGLFPKMKVYENVAYGLKFRGIKKSERIDAAYEMLKKVRLEGEEQKYPAELSGGQRQRVALARSLIIKPKLLLLDEPLSNLDAKLRLEMREEIKRLQKDFGITMIFVTHDQAEAFSLSDTVMLMNKGKIVQISSPEKLYKNPASDFALNFIGETNHKGKLYSRPEEIKLSPEGEEMTVKNKEFLGDTIIYALEDENGNILNMKTLSNTELVIGEKYKFEVNWREF